MAFDQSTRNRLQRFVNDARNLLTEEFTRQLQATYGLDPKAGSVAAVDSLTQLDNRERQTANVLRDTLAHYIATTHGKGEKDRTEQVLSRIVREQAFTVLNRLAALRMAEARGFLLETIANGYNAKGFQLYKQLAGSALGETGEAYRNYLFSVFDEFSLDLAVLFDRHSAQGRLFPRESALLELLDLINHHEIEPLWAEDETIGWIYQYFNSQEERKKMRAESKAPRNSRELAVRNQFFTPRYVVEFLTDNTLGRIWYEMTQGKTNLVDNCSYLVRRPTEIYLKQGEQAPEQEKAAAEAEALSQEELLKQPVYIPHRAIKDPRCIRMLDPACGSMHFGLYAFDLYERIYQEAWQLEAELGAEAFVREGNLKSIHQTYDSFEDYRAEIPRLIIEHNIHGVDIDPRAVQIAGLSLWQRAQRAWQQQGIKPQKRPVVRKSNIVCAEPMPGEKALLQEFSSTLNPPVLGQLLEAVFDKMELAGEAGTLLKIEEEIQSSIHKAREQWQARSGLHSVGDMFQTELDQATPQEELGFDLSGVDDESFWDGAEQLILDELSDYAYKAASNADQKRLFAEDAAKGFAFIDLCRKRFDVVLMNPPFGEPAGATRQLFKKSYPSASDNVAVAFMERGGDLMRTTGLTGSITDCSWAKKYDYSGFRQLILSHSGLNAIVHLGWGVLDNANVETNLTVRGAANLLAFTLNVSDVKNKDEVISLSALNDSPQSYFPVPRFSQLPNSVFAFEMRSEEFEAYAESAFVSASFMKAVAGVKSCNSNADFRVWWEVSCSHLGLNSEWQLLHNGSPYCPFHYPAFFAVRMDGGKWTQLMANGGARPGEAYYGKPGIAYGKRTDGMYGYIKPKAQVFSQEGQAIFPIGKVSLWAALALTNSSVFSRHHNYLNKICISIKEIPAASVQNARAAYELLRETDQANENTHLFVCPSAIEEFSLDPSSLHHSIVATKRLDNIFESQALSDKAITEALRLSNEDQEIQKTDYYSHYFGNSFSNQLVVSIWLSYAVGTCFGRWDIRYASGELQLPELPDPLESLPICPPGMLQNTKGLPAKPKDVPDDYPLRISWSGVLVDDENHQEDIVARIRLAISAIWKERAMIVEQEVSDILGMKSLRDYFRRPGGFFTDHLKRYSKSRRQAPIYWPLSTKSGTYTLWIYYHGLTPESLYICVNDFVEPKLKQNDQDINALRGRAARNNKEEIELEKLSNEIAELRDFRDELLRLAKFWKPNFNDGVQIVAAPLWKLFQHKAWQKKLKDTWESLEKGDYDWAHLACSIWPERVLRKCHQDRRLAIAHDVENTFWHEVEVSAMRGKKTTGQTRLEWQPKELTDDKLDALIQTKIMEKKA